MNDTLNEIPKCKDYTSRKYYYKKKKKKKNIEDRKIMNQS